MDPDNLQIDFYKSELYVHTEPYPESILIMVRTIYADSGCIGV